MKLIDEAKLIYITVCTYNGDTNFDPECIWSKTINLRTKLILQRVTRCDNCSTYQCH